MNKETVILATWRKFPECVPGGDTRKILIAIKLEDRAGEKVHFDIGWWYAPLGCFWYLLMDNANDYMLYWMELPHINI